MTLKKKKNTQDVDAEVEVEQGFLSHLKELRDRVLYAVLAILAVFLCLFPFAEEIYTLTAQPVLKHLPENTTMVAIGVAAPFLIPFKMVLVLSVFISLPFVLYQIWSFVAPGLYFHERRLAVPLLVSSVLLFFVGVLFAQYVILPIAVSFFFSAAPVGVVVTPDIGEYLSFALTIYFAFGIAFEVPIATILLVLAGIVSSDQLAAKRPYIIVGAFVIGMLLTPPDIISQTLLALPMWVLFELGVFLSRMLEKKTPATIETKPKD